MNVNTAVMKQVNKDLVRRYLKQMKRATKHELSVKTGLSVVTIQSLLAEMIESQEAYEGELVPSGGGRPSMEYSFNGEYAYALIAFGFQKQDRNYIKVLVVNLYGKVAFQAEAYLKEVKQDSFDAYFQEALRRYPDIRGIGLGIPGETEGGTVTMCDYKNLIGTGFLEHIKEIFDLPVLVLNDINAAIAGYAGEREDILKECITGIYFPRIYPPGAGIVINGQIHTGKSHFAGELGLLPQDTDWRNLDYGDVELLAEKIGDLLTFYSCILAPHRIILYGDFFHEKLRKRIEEYVLKRLQCQFELDIQISARFEEDYEKGMIKETLAAMDNNYKIIQKGV